MRGHNFKRQTNYCLSQSTQSSRRRSQELLRPKPKRPCSNDTPKIILVSLFAKIGISRLLAPGVLLAGLPVPNGTVAYAAFVPVTVARQQGIRTPFRSLFLRQMKQKSPAFRRRLGIKRCINPHRILTPKTVRESSMQVFWLSLPCRPSQLLLNQWHTSAEALTLISQGRDHSGGSAPDLDGIPFAWMDPVFSCAGFIPWTRRQVKAYFPPLEAIAIPRGCGIICSVPSTAHGRESMLLDEIKRDLNAIKDRIETLRRHL